MAEVDIVRAKRVGAQVWYERDRAGMSESALAGQIGISPSEISDLENGTHPRVHELAKKALSVLSRQRVASRIVERVTQNLN